MPIKSFRGSLADGAQQKISIKTNNGSTGYRIVKFQLFPGEPGVTGQQSIVKVYSVPQTSVDGAVDFNDNTILAAGYYAQLISSAEATAQIAVFDNIVFNQDITITHFEDANSVAINYYIELEQVKLDLNENTVATLKDIRNNAAQGI
jgi:hypothetical protein